MFNYTEKKDTYYPSKGEAYVGRLVTICDGTDPVGRIGIHYDLSGNTIPVDYWHKDKPVQVEYFDPESRDNSYRRTRLVDRCRNIAEGKKIFADWYKENKGIFRKNASSDVKALPASPENEFYPTPSSLAGQMAALVDWDKVETILEPSAGKGDLIEYAVRCAISRRWKRWSEYERREKFIQNTDCIEIDENLRHILTGKGYRVVHDDFLTFESQKPYDLILMNPPFSNGDEHLLKALSLQKNRGGQIVCLLNAETIRNPYTNRRKLLKEQIAEYGATVRFVSGAFSKAQRKTDVEVAIVCFRIPAARRSSFIFDGLRRAQEEKTKNSAAPEAMVSGDWVDQMVAAFNMEAKAGVALMDEYNALAPYIMSGSGQYDKPLIKLEIGEHTCDFAGTDAVNSYLKMLRYKYWSGMMNRDELTSRMTEAMQKDYSNKVRELQNYDFTRVNVESVIREITGQLCRGVEDSIMALFEELSAEHAWFPECEKNIHYYSGWATNKAHKVNSKVILPLNGFYSCWDGKKKLEAREFAGTICDIERALSYLDGDGSISRIDPYSVARIAESGERTTMSFSYFDATFYKKGTCHIKFTKEAQILVDRLNIFAARQRSWLPPSYGKKHYADMSVEEQAVIDDFQGSEAYEAVVNDPTRYIVAPAQNIAMLTA